MDTHTQTSEVLPGLGVHVDGRQQRRRANAANRPIGAAGSARANSGSAAVCAAGGLGLALQRVPTAHEIAVERAAAAAVAAAAEAETGEQDDQQSVAGDDAVHVHQKEASGREESRRGPGCSKRV